MPNNENTPDKDIEPDDEAEKVTDGTDAEVEVSASEVPEGSEKKNEPDQKADGTDQKTDKKRFGSFFGDHPVVSFIIVVIVAAGLGFGSRIAIAPIIANHTAQNILNAAKSSSGPITPLNTQVKTFTGQKIKGANVNQKELQGGGVSATSAVFAFSNGKDSTDRKTVDVYIDFSSAKSRDFILLNQTAFESMIKSGKIELRIHPVPTGSAFALYAPEAVAEAFSYKPSAAWNTMTELLKASSTIDTNKPDDIVSTVVKTANKAGVSNVTKKTITGGTFSSWIVSVGDDKNLQTGYYPPIMYVNGKQISPDGVNFNNSNDITHAILN